MTVIQQIKEDIEKLFEAESGYKISKASGVPYQTVQDLRNKKQSSKMRNSKRLLNSMTMHQTNKVMNNLTYKRTWFDT